eukprot:g2508.t3
MSNIREEPILEALESEELTDDQDWHSSSFISHHPYSTTRRTNAHGSGVGNTRALRDSMNSQDSDAETEFRTHRPREPREHTPSHRRTRVQHRDNELRRELLLRRFRSVPSLETGRHFGDLEEDYSSPAAALQQQDVEENETPRTIDSDRQTPSRSNSFRLLQNSRSSMTVSRGTGRFNGLAQLYDISSQIEAAMNEIQRLSVRPDWPRQTVSGSSPSYQTTTPLTHRSCYQLSDDDLDEEEEEMEEEDIDWNTRLHDSVFLLDDLDSDSEVSQQFEEYEHYNDVLGLHSQDTQWVSSYEDL